MKYLIQRLDKTIKSFTSFTHYSLIILFLIITSCTDKPIVVSYDIEPELSWLEEYASNNSVDIEYLNTYSFIYYEPISNQYYFATIEKTNNISYDTNNINDEKNYIDYKGLSKMPITYVGSIDLTNRIYIDNDKNQYVKKLELIDDSYYYDYEYQKQILSSPVYPYARHYDGDGGDIYELVFYSNNMDFVRSLAIPDVFSSEPPFKGELLRVGFL